MDRTRLNSPGKVTVSVTRQGVHVFPERLTVRVGDRIEWYFRTVGISEPVRVTVYFHDRSPFSWSSTEFVIPEYARQTGAVLSSSPEMPGEDFKYGVRATSAPTGETLGDDDPYITVYE